MTVKEINLNKLNIRQAQEALRQGNFSALDLSKSFLEQINNLPKELGLITALNSEGAKQRASLADERLKKGDQSPLLGIPFLVSDNFLFKGLKTSAGSQSLDNYIAPYNAELVSNLLEAGAVLLGKIRVDDFDKLGSETDNINYNFQALELNLALFTLSSANPKIFKHNFAEDKSNKLSENNLVSLKLSYGLASRFGVIGLRPSFDSLNILSKDLSDLPEILSSLRPKSKKSFDANLNTEAEIEDYHLKYKRNALSGSDSQVFKIASYQDALANFLNKDERIYNNARLQINKIESEILSYSPAIYDIISAVEGSSNLARIDGLAWGRQADDLDSAKDLAEVYKLNRSAGFSYEIKKQMILAQSLLSEDNFDDYYKNALKGRALLQEYFSELFQSVDALLSFNIIKPDFEVPSALAEVDLKDNLLLSANLAGLPYISLVYDNYQINLVSPKFFETELLKLADLINHKLC